SIPSIIMSQASMTEPAICYILDGILLFYCIITTLLFFRAKVGHTIQTVYHWLGTSYSSVYSGGEFVHR
uniref:Uncharacterized protein n=1 Tax=Hucho hucho TaxID=62062 RepID=A0A4W5MJ74_9TELE